MLSQNRAPAVVGCGRCVCRTDVLAAAVLLFCCFVHLKLKLRKRPTKRELATAVHYPTIYIYRYFPAAQRPPRSEAPVPAAPRSPHRCLAAFCSVGLLGNTSKDSSYRMDIRTVPVNTGSLLFVVRVRTTYWYKYTWYVYTWHQV